MNVDPHRDPVVNYPPAPGGLPDSSNYNGGYRPPVSDDWESPQIDPVVSMPFGGSSYQRQSGSYGSNRSSFGGGNFSSSSFDDNNHYSRSNGRHYSNEPYKFHPAHLAAIPILGAPVAAAAGGEVFFIACTIVVVVGIVAAVAYLAKKFLFEERISDSDMYAHHLRNQNHEDYEQTDGRRTYETNNYYSNQYDSHNNY